MQGRKQTTIRLPDDLAERAEAVARVRGVSLNTLFVDAITAEIDRVTSTKSFGDQARELRRREKALLKKRTR
jgi:predicted transcriptional regulator